MEFLKFDGEFTPSFYWEFSAEINKDYTDETDKEILELIEKINFCTEKVSVGKNSLKVSYFLPVMKNKTFLTKGFTQFLTTGLIKSISIDVFNAEHNKLFTVFAVPSPLKCPDWQMDLTSSDREFLALNVIYEIDSVKII